MRKSSVVSIDFRAFFVSLLEQWKCMVIFAVIGAVLVPYAISKRENGYGQSEADRYKELSMMSDEEKLNTLPELDHVRVALALKEKGLIEEQERYYENSIVDPMLETGSLPVLRFRYVISDSGNIEALNSAYCSLLTDSKTVAAVRNSLAPAYSNTEDIYIIELITADPSEAVDITVIIPEDTDVDGLRNAVSSRIDDANSDLAAEFGQHKISLVSVEEISIVDEERVSAKAEKDIQYKDLKETYTALVLEFDYAETLVFNSITIEDDTRNTFEDPGITFAPKMIAAGFMVGVIFYIFVYLMYIVLSSKIHDSSVISDTLGVSVLGVISKYSHKGFASVIYSKIVYKLLRKKSIDGRSVGKTAEAAVSICKREGCRKVLFVKPGMKSDYSDVVKELTAKISKASGIDVRAVDKITDEKELEGCDSVIIGVCSGSTGYSDVFDIARKCSQSGRKIIGGIYFD